MLKPRLILFVVIVALAGGFAVGNDAVVIFKKTLPDGRAVSVVKTTRHEIQQPTQTDQERLPKGFVAVGGDLRIDHYSMKIRDESGHEVIAWQKEVKSLVIPAGQGFNDEVKVHDVAEKEGQIAVLFSAGSTDVEIVGQDEHNKYGTRSHRSIFAQSSLCAVSFGTLSWLDDLYVLLVSSPGGTEIWRMSKDKAVKIFQDN